MSKFAQVRVKIIKDINGKAFDELRARLKAEHSKINVGVPGSQKETDGTPVALIAAVHEFGSPAQGIPERPFLRTTIQENRGKYVQLNRRNLVAVLNGKMTVEQALGQLGEVAKGDVQLHIASGTFAPLKAATIKRKGSMSPLIDTGQLRQSITWEVSND
jgi:phage gpG-like protein